MAEEEQKRSKNSRNRPDREDRTGRKNSSQFKTEGRPPRDEDQGRQGPPPPPGFQMGRALKTSLGWMAIILLAFLLARMFSSEGNVKQINDFTELEEYIHSGRVEKAVITGRKFRGEFKEPLVETLPSGRTREYTEFETVLPSESYVDREVIDKWKASGLRFEFQEEKAGWLDYIWGAWPILLILFFWFFIMRRMQGGIGGQSSIFNFGKSRAKLMTPDKPQVTFQDVAGCDEAKEELQEIIEFLKSPKRFIRLGGKIPKGALLLGPPGTGKTLLAKAVAGEADVPFFSLSGADFVELFVGVGASRVRDLFEQGKKHAPCIIFIDELDAVGRHRGAGLGGGHDEREQTLNQLLVEMDGFDTNTNVILLAATNRPDVLDNALLRPGRFDRQIIVDAPGLEGREGILKVHTKEIPMGDDVDLRVVARGTPGLVGADLANLVNEAALLAARKKRDKVCMEDIEEAKDKIMMGIERRSVILSDEERKVTAYHEAGHAIVAYHTKGADPLHKITIIPRGRALGVTAQLPLDDKHNYTRSYIRGRLDILMGGRAAEKLIFDELTTGAANDLELATELARRMVVEWGMSEKVGPTTLGKAEQELFLGREIQQHKEISEETAQAIDGEIRAIVKGAEKQARDLLSTHIEKLHTLAKALLEHETIHGSDLPRLFEGKPLIKASRDGKPKSKSGTRSTKAKSVKTTSDEKTTAASRSKTSKELETSAPPKPRKSTVDKPTD